MLDYEIKAIHEFVELKKMIESILEPFSGLHVLKPTPF